MCSSVIEYYEKYFTEGNREDIKREYLFSILENRRLYKFIPFNDDVKLNDSKLNCFENGLLWISCIYSFDDKTELEMVIDYERASKILHKTQQELKEFVDCIREFDDVSCFTNSIRDEMWKEYANNYNGFCLEFELKDTDYFQPVIYCDKAQVDYTEYLIDYYNASKNPLSSHMANPDCIRFVELAGVLKDKEKYGFEQEIRLRTSDAYDDPNCILHGRVSPHIKKIISYKGFSKKYEECGIELKKVYIGNKVSSELREQLKRRNKLNIPLVEI